MINREYCLTVDDLIMEYIIYKVQNGYEVNFSSSEFMSFLSYFEDKMLVNDVIYDIEVLFKRFFERKNTHDWYNKPHLDCEYVDNDFVVKANYRLSDFDRSIINTYFMDYKKQVQIRNIIGSFLEDYDKRKMDMDTVISKNNLEIGKCVAVLIVNTIWKNYVNDQVIHQMWPKQCTDMNKYLLDIDLALIIGCPSIREILLKIYVEFSSKIAIMYQNDNELQISSYSNSYLAYSNYKYLIQDYEGMFRKYCGTIKINLKELEFREIDRYDYNISLESFEDVKVKAMIRKIDKVILKK